MLQVCECVVANILCLFFFSTGLSETLLGVSCNVRLLLLLLLGFNMVKCGIYEKCFI